MTIYCPLAEALGIDPGEVSILDTKDYARENCIVPGIRKGMLHSEETKKLMSEKRKKYLKNKPGPMTGKNHSEETKQKMRTSRIKYLHTDEGAKTFQKWQEAARKSEKRSESARQQCLTMNKNPDKISKTAEKHRGMKRSPECRAKMSEARKRYYQNLKMESENGDQNFHR